MDEREKILKEIAGRVRGWRDKLQTMADTRDEAPLAVIGMIAALGCVADAVEADRFTLIAGPPERTSPRASSTLREAPSTLPLSPCNSPRS